MEIVTPAFDGADPQRTALPVDPIARTGWEEGGPLLDVVSLGRLLSDGTIAVADVGSEQVLLFDGSLEPLEVFGRAGEGPGEFGRISGLAEMGSDSLVVWDSRQRRVTVLDQDDLGFRTVGHNPQGGVEHAVAAASDRSLLWTPQSPYARPVEASQWLEIPVLRSDAALERFDTLTSLPFAEVVIVDGRPTTRPIALSADFDAGPGGFAWLRLDVPELRFFDAESGRLDRIIRWTEQPEAVTDARWNTWVDERMAMFENAPGPTPPLDAMRRSLEGQRSLAPANFPLFSGIELASDGSTWIHRRPIPGSEGSRYLVVSADGRCLMNVQAPDRFLFMDSRDGLILGRDSNELGVHAIALYERPECPTA